MKKIVALVILSAASLCFGQSTTVSVTVVDGGGQTWVNGYLTYQFLNTTYPQSPTWNGSPLPSNYLTPTKVTLDSSGSASFSIPSSTSITPIGATWRYSFCPTAAPINCQNINIATTGSTQNISASVTAFLQPIIV